MRTYEEWKQEKLKEENPDLEVLESIIFAVQQYLSSPTSQATKKVLGLALECSERWAKERKGINDND